MSSTVRSRKNKGQRFQKELVMSLRKLTGLDESEESCFEGDIQANLMGGQGIDVKLSPEAQKQIPFDIEAKNQETWSVPSWWKQTIANTKEGRIPLLAVKRNRHEPLAIIRWDDLLRLLK